MAGDLLEFPYVKGGHGVKILSYHTSSRDSGERAHRDVIGGGAKEEAAAEPKGYRSED